jgi:hypothetical protein
MRSLLAVVLLAGAAQDRAVVEAIDEAVRRIPNFPPGGARVDDAGFLKRVTKDLAGSAPSEAELRAFAADPDPRKRARRVEELLADPRFAASWARRWMEVFFGPLETRRPAGFLPALDPSVVPCSLAPDASLKPGAPGWGERVTMSLLPGLSSTARTRIFRRFEAWLRDQIGKDRPWNEVVSDMIEARGNAVERPEAAYKLSFFRGQGLPLEFALGISRHHLGIRLRCAGCHDHPFDRWTVDNLYQTAAFAARERGRVAGASAELWSADAGEVLLPGDGIRPGAAAPPVFLLGGLAGEKDDRVKVLARLMTSKANPQFARALANRVWSWLLGHPIVDPVDDFNLRNKARSVPLLEALTRSVVDGGHSVKALLRTICATELYQREGEDRKEEDWEFVWRGTLRRPSRSLLPAIPKEREKPLPVPLEPPPGWRRVSAGASALARWQAPSAGSGRPADLYLYSVGDPKVVKGLVEQWLRQVREQKSKETALEGGITLREISGQLVCDPGGVGDGPTDFMLLAAPVPRGDTPLLFRFEGPAETVRERREGFLGFLKAAAK